MTIGYLAAGKCWSTTSEAVDAYYSTPFPSALQTTVTGTSSTHFLYTYAKASGVWNLYRTTPGSAPTLMQAAPTNVYGTCTLDEPPQPYPTILTCTNCGGGTGIPSTGTGTGWDGTYDYTIGTAAWTFAFITIMGCWLIAKHAGEILDFINRPTR